ncbi:Zinc carboxypeptidase [Nonlabens sp. Hel1_33_55]|uniref:M14 family zinc carboxypeptidase n=1 Tax=Nonlabens sp. Hel1_33_55 TaxID=1336802 RepID=UPI000875A9D1|nr:M14 family zinc carboxypeptidase [Nonlabens sp. Hel1_33_55]SCY08836.1 Zinc carboxypeptidase [Nonlabens sp. Hel1_33_55]
MNHPLIKLNRYYSYEHYEKVLMEVIEKLPQDFYSFSYLGSSVENRSIFGIRLGHGDFKILAWSQMHGNESSTTRAIIELLQSEKLFEILKSCSLYIIPVLNPDGAQYWTRNNANNVDLNRDAQKLSQPESVILKDVIDFFEPDLALNLHGQRTIYGVEQSVLPCQLSFLTPSADPEKSITKSRVRSMQLINAIATELGSLEAAAIGRYDDSFNINCWGDYCQSLDIPTILFEAGHAGNDYDRSRVVELIKASLITVIENSAKMDKQDTDQITQSYFAIPEVAKNYTDVLLLNLPSVKGKRNIAIMYHEQVVNDHLEFVPMIYVIDDPKILYGHKIIDVSHNQEFENDLIISQDMMVTSESLKINSFIK